MYLNLLNEEAKEVFLDLCINFIMAQLSRQKSEIFIMN